MNNARREQIYGVIGELNEIKQRIEAIQSQEEDAYDNMPEGIRDSFRGCKSQDAIDSLGEALDWIDEVTSNLGAAAL